LRGKWREIAKLTEYWAQTSAIFGLNILVLPSDESRLQRAQTIRARHGLLTNDSLIVAAMEDFGIHSLANRDNDFDHISELVIYKPTDI
jgi:predicted nucleic acid-binding protein